MALIGGLSALGALLLLFQGVVRQQTTDGERRRAAMTSLSAAAAHCNTLTRTAERVACQTALAPVPRDNASLNRGGPAGR